MIGKAKSNQSLAATIEYNEKEKATLVYKNKLAGTNLPDFRMQMEDLQKCYTGRSAQLTIHAILSPAIEDGKNLSAKQWQAIANKYLHQMNLQSHQAIGFIHADKEHRHLHLIINKVKESNFKLFNDSFIGKKSQHAADAIAKEMNLVRAMQIKQNNILFKQRKAEMEIVLTETLVKENEKKILGTKQQFKAEMQSILQKNKFISVTAYFNVLQNAGFKLHQYLNKETGDLRGYGVEKNGTKMDSSAIGKEFTLKNLQLLFEKITEKEVCTVEEKNKLKKEEALQIITDKTKIIAIENFIHSMNISKERIKNNHIEMFEQEKNYFIGMKNDSGGYTLHNSFSKCYNGKKDITTIICDNDAPTVVVEDMFDYLRCKQNNESLQLNFIILHSLLNKEKVAKKLKKINAKNIFISLKNDDIGKTIAHEFLNIFKGAKNIDLINESLPDLHSLMKSSENKIQQQLFDKATSFESKSISGISKEVTPENNHLHRGLHL